jgi:DNA repair protein RadC
LTEPKGKPENTGLENQYVVVDLRVIKREQLPESTGIPELLEQWGLNHRAQESVWVVAYDGAGGLRRVAEVARGSFHDVDVPIAATLSIVHLCATDRFILVHNHPTGIALPTRSDIDLTSKMIAAANQSGVRMDDHLIIGPDGEVFSFHDSGMLKLPEDRRRRRKVTVQAAAEANDVRPVRINHNERA